MRSDDINYLKENSLKTRRGNYYMNITQSKPITEQGKKTVLYS